MPLNACWKLFDWLLLLVDAVGFSDNIVVDTAVDCRLLMPFIRLVARDDVLGGVNEIDHNDCDRLLSAAPAPVMVVDDDKDNNAGDDETDVAVGAFPADVGNCVALVNTFNGLAGSKKYLFTTRVFVQISNDVLINCSG